MEEHLILLGEQLEEEEEEKEALALCPLLNQGRLARMLFLTSIVRKSSPKLTQGQTLQEKEHTEATVFQMLRRGMISRRECEGWKKTQRWRGKRKH